MKMGRNGLLILVLMLVLLAAGCSSDADDAGTTVADATVAETTIASATSEETTAEETTAEETSTEMTTAEEMTMIEFKNEEKNFKLMIPSTWIIVDKDRYGILIRPYEGTQTSFYVDTHTTIFADYPFDSFVGEMIGDLKRIRRDSVFEESENIEINGYPFVALPYSGTASDGTIYYYKAYFTAKDLGYEMYYVAPETEFDTYVELMEEIAMSFEFIN